MSIQFTRATKEKLKLRMAFIGPAGSGKTYSALNVAKGLGSKIAVVDTEHGAASKYSDEFVFDTLQLTSYSPERYIEAIKAAALAGYEVLVIDSLSHAWMGKDGALELVDRAAAKSKGNSYVAWRDVTPMHNRMVDAMLAAPLHIIVTMRSKTEYVQEKDQNGKTIIRKVGTQPVQRDGLDFEFDVVGDMDDSNTLLISKTRCRTIQPGDVISKPGAEFATQLAEWLDSGTDVPRATDEQIFQLQEFTMADGLDTKLVTRVKSLLEQHTIGKLTPEKAQQAIDTLTSTLRKASTEATDVA